MSDTDIRAFKRQLGTPVRNGAVVANTNIYTSDFVANLDARIIYVFCAFDGAGVLTGTTTKSGTTCSVKFNTGDALTLGCMYVFCLPVDIGETFNFKYSASCNAIKFSVYEVDACP